MLPEIADFVSKTIANMISDRERMFASQMAPQNQHSLNAVKRETTYPGLLNERSGCAKTSNLLCALKLRKRGN